MRKKTPTILLVVFAILLSLGCKKDLNTSFNIESSGVKLSERNQLKDTIITSVFENSNYSIAKILIRKNNSEITKLDTLYGPFPSISSKIIDSNLAIIQYKYGQGSSIESRHYKINLNDLTIKKMIQTTVSFDTLFVLSNSISIKLVDFSDEKNSDIVSDKSLDRIYFKMYLNSNSKEGTANLYQYENYVKKLHQDKELMKLKNSCNTDIFSIVENYISYSNITCSYSLNNMAYYLEQSGLYKEAIYLLEKIIENFPDRTVAYINLGDAYWGLGKKEHAKNAYLVYVEQMTSKNKKEKIPKRVLERTK